MSEEDVNEGVSEAVAEPLAEQDDQQVNWQAANETMRKQKQEIEFLNRQKEMLEQQAQLYAANMQNMNKAPQPAQQQAPDPFSELDDDDPYKRVLQKALAQKETQFNETVQGLQSTISELALKNQYSDFDEVVNKALPKIQANPRLLNALRSSGDPGVLAYEIGKAMAVDTQKQEAQRQEAERLLANAQKPQASKTGTGSGGLSRTEHIQSMSAKDFENYVANVKRRG